jgi:hypothetical protein
MANPPPKKPVNTILTRDDILRTLRVEKPLMREKYGVLEIGLFGSYATGTPNQESDIDLLVDFEAPRFDHLAGLQLFLENEFNKKIEIVRKGKNLKNRFLQKIEGKVIYV